MKFSEIKDKIKNLGDYKSLKENKEAGLRIVKNKKTGDYWLIEKEFLKPVIKSPRECKSILIKPDDLKYKVFMCHKPKKELRSTKALAYIKWGEKQKYHKRPTCSSRKYWWDLETNGGNFLWWKSIGERFCFFWNKLKISTDQRNYFIRLKEKTLEKSLVYILNSTFYRLFIEANAREMTGNYTIIELPVEDVERLDVPLLKVEQKKKLKDLLSRKVNPIFQELGFDKDKPIRQQEPKPLLDRKKLDNIVFDALGLTKQERKEVYWAVAELVKSRLDKAKSV